MYSLQQRHTESNERRCPTDTQIPRPQTSWSGDGTHAQKSSTVLNLVTRRRLACHILLLSFLKNHRAHLKDNRAVS